MKTKTKTNKTEKTQSFTRAQISKKLFKHISIKIK